MEDSLCEQRRQVLSQCLLDVASQAMAEKVYEWCRGPESNWLRPPFQGGALPMSYPGIVELFNFRDDSQRCQFGFRAKLATRCVVTPAKSAITPKKLCQLRPAIPSAGPVVNASS